MSGSYKSDYLRMKKSRDSWKDKTKSVKEELKRLKWDLQRVKQSRKVAKEKYINLRREFNELKTDVDVYNEEITQLQAEKHKTNNAIVNSIEKKHRGR